jgi:serine/threonine protein kinase
MVPTYVIAPGTKLSHFEIVEKLGEGGMGVVYKARDLNLDRLVAIKILSAGAVSNPDRQARFVQEAKAASSLNHPNIITVYEIDTTAELPFIAMEYVDGKTLDRLIPSHGMPLDDALRYAVQITGASSDAHAAGITHRDLKPANVMVTDKGNVKVLDFGLAKLSEHSGEGSGLAGGTAVATAGMQQLKTEEGTILGTFSYMSPEQAEGKKVDGRSDIFSFGVMLYQMLTGLRPFRGDSRLSTMAAILREEPRPAGELVTGLPAEVDRVLARAMRKDPARRFQTMADLKVALEELRDESSSGRLSMLATTARPRPKTRWPLIAGAVAAVLVLAAGVWMLRKAGQPMPPQTIVPLTTYAGSELNPAFSPDGNQVAFSWDGEKQENFDIYIKLVEGGGTPVRLTTDPASDIRPA